MSIELTGNDSDDDESLFDEPQEITKAFVLPKTIPLTVPLTLPLTISKTNTKSLKLQPEEPPPEGMVKREYIDRRTKEKSTEQIATFYNHCLKKRDEINNDKRIKKAELEAIKKKKNEERIVALAIKIKKQEIKNKNKIILDMIDYYEDEEDDYDYQTPVYKKPEIKQIKPIFTFM